MEKSGALDNKVDIKRENKSLYKFDRLLEYVELAYTQYLSNQEGGTEEEVKKEKERKAQLRLAANDCYAGIEKDRELVKQFISRLLTGGVEVYIKGYSEDFRLTDETVNYVFNWKNPSRLPTYVKFMCILQKYKLTYGRDALGNFIDKYGFNRLREIDVVYECEHSNKGMYINKEDIIKAFEDEHITLSYELKLDIIVQMLFEEFKGNSVIDEILYQNIDDISIGLNGLTDEIVPYHLKDTKIPFAYDCAWIMYKGALINMSFVSFKSFKNLRRVVRNIAGYKQKGEFSEKEGFKLGYGKDDSRRTSVISPFGENDAAWVRKFTAKTMSNKDMVKGGSLEISGYEKVLQVERMLIMGGATVPICGPQGAGKTTKLGGLIEYIQNFYTIRMLESEFEARVRQKYPEKNIFTMQTVDKTPEEAYEFSLRTSGNIYVISEVRSDEMAVNITRTANRGGRCVFFTYHPNKPRATVIEIANSLIRQKLYTSLKDAMYTTLESIKCCIHIDVDLERGCRYYNIYEFVPTSTIISSFYKKLQGNDRRAAFMDTVYDYMIKTSSEEYFEVVPIITYNREKRKYEFNNNISDELYMDLYRKMSLNEERDELTRIFRPDIAFMNYLDINIINTEDLKSEADVKAIAKEIELNMDLFNAKEVIEKIRKNEMDNKAEWGNDWQVGE